MSHIIGIVLALVSIGVTTCKALPDLHKQMSPQQLQSVFQVDSPEAVPHYQVIQLLHHNNQEQPATHFNHYRRRKRSIETIQQLQEHNKLNHETHHVKKDLSKNPYYSELKSDSLAKSHKNSVYESSKPVKDIQEHKVSMTAFGKNVNLTLKQTQSLFKNGQLHRLPMWFADNEANTTTQGINLEKIEDEHTHTSDTIGEVFQDEENMAAILMRRHEVTGDLVMEGSIGHDMVIKPLPHDLSPDHKEAHHVIFKRAADLSEHLSDFAFMEPDDLATSEKLEKLQNRHKRSAHRTTLDDIELEEEFLEAEDGIDNDEFATHKRAKRQSPYIIYPEILVIVDYDGYRLHGGDNLQVKRYFISFWNGVDLRYRLLKGPRIRISIAGIIISRGRDATPYLERNRVGRDAIDSAAALTDMGKYLFRERRLPVYDIAVAITKYDMCRRRKGGRCTKGTAGFAYVGGACVVNKRLEKVNSVAIIEDTGGFSGIIVAAHEVGHLLGAVHDGSPPPSYLGGPGAQRCRWEDGYIMSDLRHTERGFRWSPCTVQSFHHFLNGDTATCLHNAPHEDSALGRSMPGTLLSLDAQCRRDRGTYACFKDERVCAQLFCFDAQTGYCVAYRPAAEGSSCGNSLHCLDGRCTPLPSNVIPNYGHQYRLGYNNSHNNAASPSATTTTTTNDDHQNANIANENDDEEDDEGNGGEDNDESNETVEKQKRKLSIPFTTKTLQQQQQLKATPPNPTTAMPPATTTLSSGVTSARYGVKTSVSSTTTTATAAAAAAAARNTPTPTFFEAYFRKLQNLNNRPTATTTTTEIPIAKLKINKKSNNKNNGHSNDDEEESVTSFEAQFLKRTLNPTIEGGGGGGGGDSFSSQTNNPYSKNFNTKQKTTTIITTDTDTTITTTTLRSTSSGSGSSSNSNFQKTLDSYNKESVTPQPPIYVTNYIGDNTQRLTSIVPHHRQRDTATTALLQQQQQQQQQQQNSHQPSSPQNFETLIFSSTTRRPKIKTQKLIRRLRTQIK